MNRVLRVWVAGIAILCAGVIGVGLTGCQSASKSATQPAPTAGDGTATSQPGVAQKQPRIVANAAQPGLGKPFDFYLLNLSWSPEFCVTHPSGVECGQHRGFIVHGLWPQDTNGSYPQNCGTRPGPTNPASWADVMPDVGLVQHEWLTHGTCTPFDADTYFAMIRKAFEAVRVPTVYVDGAKQISMTPPAILAGFAQVNPSFPAGSIAMSCGNNQLTAVEVCLSKDLQPIACSGVRSCKANVVKITPVN
jgi:ribonuclease T2